MQLSLTSFALAVPAAIGILAMARKPTVQAWNERIAYRIQDNRVFAALVGLLMILYVSSLSQNCSYDDFSNAIGLRADYLFVGANHFLFHYIGYLIYQPLRSFTDNTLVFLQLVNIAYTLALLLAVRQLILLVTQDRALAHLAALLVGISYGIWKFGKGAKAYPSMLLIWVLTVLQGVRIYEQDDSWGQFFILSALSNLGVLAHDMAALMAPAFLLSWLMAPPVRRRLLITRYVVTGLVLLSVFQFAAAYVSGIRSFSQLITHHLFYVIHPDVQPGDYHYTTYGNLFIVAREGLYSMFTGIESAWRSFSVKQIISTFVVHTVVAALLGCLYVTALMNLIWHLKEHQKLRFPLILILSNWLVIYAFCLLWRPNDEVHHWLLPFTVMGLCIALAIPNRAHALPFYMILGLLIPAVGIAASGLYSSKSYKLMTIPFRERWLENVPNNDSMVFSANGNSIELVYYRPSVVLTTKFKVLVDACMQGKTVLINSTYFPLFVSRGYQLQPWTPLPYYSQVICEQRPHA